jgi:hypothetical protein
VLIDLGLMTGACAIVSSVSLQKESKKNQEKIK